MLKKNLPTTVKASTGSNLRLEGLEALHEKVLEALCGSFMRSFYLTYRKQPEDKCADGSCTVSPENKAKQKMLLWFSTAAVVALAAFPHYSGVLVGDVGAAGSATLLGASTDDGETIAVF